AVVTADRGLAGLPRPTSFPSYRKYEKRYYFLATPKDTCTGYFGWTFPYTDGTFTDSLTMWTPDVDPAGSVRFQSRLLGVSLAPYQHALWMRWKRPSDGLLTPVATRTWGGRDALLSDTTFTASRIASGTNRLDFRGYSLDLNNPEGGASGGSIQSYAVTYDRLYRAFQNRLDCNSSGAQGDFEIEIDGFTAPALPTPTVYDVSDSTAPRVLLIPPAFVRSTASNVWAARFQDQAPTASRRRYLAVLAAPQVSDAAVARAGRVAGVPIWDTPGRPELVIVTPELFRPAAERLAAHRRAQGYEVLVAPENEVYDAFDGGRRSDWAIRRLLEYAFARWNSRFAVLVGDASEDARNELATSDRDWMPAHLISGPIGTSNGQELSASDFWYINDLDNTSPPGPACTNSEPDPFPDMSIGRLPVGSVAEANGLVDKLIAYDGGNREAAWRHKVVLLPDDAYSFASFFGEATTQYCFRSEEQVFEAISNQLGTILRSEGGYRDLDIEQFRLREKLAPLGRPVPGDPSLCQSLDNLANVRAYVSAYTGPQLLTDLANGCLVLNFQGHGSATVLAHESIWRQDRGSGSTDLLFNEGKPFFFLSFSCHVNQFTTYIEKLSGDALGEVMVLGPQNPARPSAGAIGSYASTNFELLPSDRTGRNHLNNWLFRAMFVDPPHDPFLGERGARVLLGEAITLGAVNSSAATFGLERRAIQTYCLLGDPSTPIETGAPRLYATANGQDVASGVRFQPGAPGDSVALVVDLVDESRIDDLTLSVTGEGARAVAPSEYTISPTYPDTLNGGGGRRYLLTWNVRPQAKDADLTVSCKDRSGLAASFTLPLRLETRLFANGQSIGEGDVAPSVGAYQLVVNSPAQLQAADFDLTVDGTPPAGFAATVAPTDSSRRLWVLSWPGSYETGSHDAVLVLPGGATRRVSFLTSNEPRVALRRVFAFPTPFAAPPVTINFTLDTDRPTTVAVKVYTVSGSLVYQRVEPGVSPGYHQWIWDGTDTYGAALANGAYLYQVVAEDDRGLKAVERGRLARLR
ncbi:MAG: C25 family cysteine peptidase, partial [Candidatus Eisenbacteria bacterium]